MYIITIILKKVNLKIFLPKWSCVDFLFYTIIFMQLGNIYQCRRFSTHSRFKSYQPKMLKGRKEREEKARSKFARRNQEILIRSGIQRSCLDYFDFSSFFLFRSLWHRFEQVLTLWKPVSVREGSEEGEEKTSESREDPFRDGVEREKSNMCLLFGRAISQYSLASCERI